MRQLKRVPQIHISAGEILDVFLKQLIRNRARKIFGFIRCVIQENQQPFTRWINNRQSRREAFEFPHFTPFTLWRKSLLIPQKQGNASGYLHSKNIVVTQSGVQKMGGQFPVN